MVRTTVPKTTKEMKDQMDMLTGPAPRRSARMLEQNSNRPFKYVIDSKHETDYYQSKSATIKSKVSSEDDKLHNMFPTLLVSPIPALFVVPLIIVYLKITAWTSKYELFFLCLPSLHLVFSLVSAILRSQLSQSYR